MLAEIGGEQAVIRDSLLRDAFLDHDAFGKLIKHAEEKGHSGSGSGSFVIKNWRIG